MKTRKHVERELAESQRKNERRAKEIINLLDKNGRLHHELRRLEKSLVAIFRYCKADTPENMLIRDIVLRTCPSAIGRHLEQANRRETYVTLGPLWTWDEIEQAVREASSSNQDAVTIRIPLGEARTWFTP